jgi:5'-nucleotidase
MQPFGNALVVMTLTGAQLKTALEEQQKPGAAEPRFLQPSRGLSYTWKQKAPFGERVTGLTLEGKPVEPGARYRVTVNSFLAEGGDGFKTFTEGTERTGGPLDASALVAFLGAHRPYTADPVARIAIAD